MKQISHPYLTTKEGELSPNLTMAPQIIVRANNEVSSTDISYTGPFRAVVLEDVQKDTDGPNIWTKDEAAHVRQNIFSNEGVLFELTIDTETPQLLVHPTSFKDSAWTGSDEFTEVNINLNTDTSALGGIADVDTAIQFEKEYGITPKSDSPFVVLSTFSRTTICYIKAEGTWDQIEVEDISDKTANRVRVVAGTTPNSVSRGLKMIACEDPEKVSEAKKMDASGVWKGLEEDEEWHDDISPKESPTGGALIVKKTKKGRRWAVGMVKPKKLWPDPNSDRPDSTAVTYNAYKEADTYQHKPITNLSSESTGSENEWHLLVGDVDNDVHEAVKHNTRLHPHEYDAGRTTYEVAGQMIETNGPPVPTDWKTLVKSKISHYQTVLKTLKERGIKAVITSSRPLNIKGLNYPNDPYVKSVISTLAHKEQFTQSWGTLSWIAHSSGETLGVNSGDELKNKLENPPDNDFFDKAVLQFDAAAIHTHHKPDSEPNPHFYAEYLNKTMGGIGRALGVMTYSGPFRNGVYAKLHEYKLITRSWFRKAGYQPAYKVMGSEEALAEMNENITVNSATSLTRAGISDDKTYGDTRLRYEKLRTAEVLMGSATPLPEVETAFQFGNSLNMALMSHYYNNETKTSEVPKYARRFFSNPNEKRYNLNRIASAAHGPFADFIDGDGNVTTHREFLLAYAKFAGEETKRLGIQLEDGDLKAFQDQLEKSVSIPTEGWNVENYMNPDHKDYSKGVLSTHLIAELLVKAKGEEKWRTHYKDSDGHWQKMETFEDGKKWWHNVTQELDEGKYEEEIKDIMEKYSDQIEKRYKV